MQVLSSYHPLALYHGADAPTPAPSAAPQGSAPSLSVSEGRSRELMAEVVAGPEPEMHARETKAVSALKYRRSERTTLYVQTQEGDVVRLKFRTRDAMSLRFEREVEEQGAVSELSLDRRSATKLKVSVKGDLNADELAAIQFTIGQAFDLAEDFFDGDVQAAFQSAAALEIDGSQLAKVKVKMRLQERVTYSQRGFSVAPRTTRPQEQVQAAPVRVDRDASPVSESSSPVVSAPVAISSEAAPESIEESEEIGAIDEGLVGQASDEPRTVPETAEVRSRFETLQKIDAFLIRLLETFGAREVHSSVGSLDVSLKLRVFESTLVTLSQLRPEPETQIPPLVHETIDALAAQEHAPVDQVA